MRLVFDHDITQMLHADDQHPVEQFAAEATAWAFMGGGQLPYCSPANQATSAQCLLWEAMVTQIPLYRFKTHSRVSDRGIHEISYAAR
jgi:hypothetical protein